MWLAHVKPTIMISPSLRAIYAVDAIMFPKFSACGHRGGRRRTRNRHQNLRKSTAHLLEITSSNAVCDGLGRRRQMDLGVYRDQAIVIMM
jgi:hypothetical protein